jgi:8-oxo-dGTP pyrophosphatase MutT (NUDIX family)
VQETAQPKQSAIVYESPWLRVREDHYTIEGTDRTYHIVERDASVVIIPLSPTGRALLVRQWRIPTAEYSWELPMGGIDPGEDPPHAAARELHEETGIRADRLILLGTYRAVPGLTPQPVHVFRAGVTDRQLQTALAHPNVDDIRERRIWTLPEIRAGIGTQVTDGFTLASLMLLSAQESRA